MASSNRRTSFDTRLTICTQQDNIQLIVQTHEMFWEVADDGKALPS